MFQTETIDTIREYVKRIGDVFPGEDQAGGLAISLYQKGYQPIGLVIDGNDLGLVIAAIWYSKFTDGSLRAKVSVDVAYPGPDVLGRIADLEGSVEEVSILHPFSGRVKYRGQFFVPHIDYLSPTQAIGLVATGPAAVDEMEAEEDRITINA